MSNKADLAQPRETGSEKASTTCVQCGGEVPVVETAYGSTAPGACPKCWPQADDSKDQLTAQKAAAAKDAPTDESADPAPAE